LPSDKEEATLCRELHTPALAEMHVPVASCWQNSMQQHRYIGDFVSHPNDCVHLPGRLQGMRCLEKPSCRPGQVQRLVRRRRPGVRQLRACQVAKHPWTCFNKSSSPNFLMRV